MYYIKSFHGTLMNGRSSEEKPNPLRSPMVLFPHMEAAKARWENRNKVRNHQDECTTLTLGRPLHAPYYIAKG